MKHPAVRLNGNVYVTPIESPPSPTTRYLLKTRTPVRHTDSLTRAIQMIAANSKLPDYTAQKIIKNIDMGRMKVEFGKANIDGSEFELDIST